MNILYYHWNENSRDDMVSAFRAKGHHVFVTEEQIQGYDNVEACEKAFAGILKSCAVDFLFSFNYFPFLSEFAHTHALPYVCWVYDCPHLTLYSVTVKNPENHIFIFDRRMCDQAEANGAKHVYHLPLAVAADRLSRRLSGAEDKRYEVSFVGSLYTQNMYDQIHYLPGYLRGYLEGVMEAQQKVWGYNMVRELLTDEIVDEMAQYIKLEYDPRYMYGNKEIFTDFIFKKICALERRQLLAGVKEKLTLFTGEGEQTPEGVVSSGIVDYVTEMPQVFRQSRINLNISLRSIESGIPLRALDIMGAGGFLLSNYQPELAEMFAPGEEFVYFESEGDMLEKIAYYLAHDEQREQIARNGQAKALRKFSYSAALDEILQKISKIC